MQASDSTRAVQARRMIGFWLLALVGMVFVMVVLGGLTRLTESGLSIVEWKPATGWLPPLTTEAWEAEFRAYQAYPEYQKINAGMTLAQFQGIYWLEYVHRLWGRLIGLALALPLVFFLIRGLVERATAWKLVGALVLGGLQGVLGWYMVSSGLVDRPDVSQYRLAAHLALALVIYAYLFWVALGLLCKPPAAQGEAAQGEQVFGPVSRACVLRAAGIVAMVMVTMIAGAFVAGLDAGYAYNTFPLMDGELIPSHLFAITPAWRSLFEDVTTVQFVHRLLAFLTLTSVLVFRLKLRGEALSPRARGVANLLALWVLVQFCLGVATLLSFVAVPIASMHQASAVVLFTLALWSLFELYRLSGGRSAQPTLPAASPRMPGSAVA